MTTASELRFAESNVMRALEVLIAAYDRLEAAREAIPALADQYRRSGPCTETAVSAFADALHAQPSALARHLLAPLSATPLGTLIRTYAGSCIDQYGARTLPPAA